MSLCRYLAQTLTRNKTEEMNYYRSLNRSGFFSSKLSVIDGISQDNNTCHIRFFVGRIMHFLYASEAVNKFVIKLHCIIELLSFQKNVCIYFQKG